MIVHALDVSGHPTDTALEEGELEVLITIQQPGAKNAGQPGHDRKDARQHSVGKMMFEKFIDDGKLQAEVNGNGHLQPVGLGKKYVVIWMVESFLTGRAIDHDRCHTDGW